MIGSRGPVLSDDDPLPPAHDVATELSITLSALYRQEAPKLVRQLSKRIAHDRAQDVVQRVFVRVTARFQGDRRPLQAPAAYLRETARNLLRDDARCAARTGQEQHVPLDETMLPDADPIAALEARDRLARIEAAVGRLKPLTRQIFLARRIDGYSYDEIARRTGLSVRGVEKQMSRALRQLGRHLRDD